MEGGSLGTGHPPDRLADIQTGNHEGHSANRDLVDFVDLFREPSSLPDGILQRITLGSPFNDSVPGLRVNSLLIQDGVNLLRQIPNDLNGWAGSVLKLYLLLFKDKEGLPPQVVVPNLSNQLVNRLGFSEGLDILEGWPIAGINSKLASGPQLPQDRRFNDCLPS